MIFRFPFSKNVILCIFINNIEDKRYIPTESLKFKGRLFVRLIDCWMTSITTACGSRMWGESMKMGGSAFRPYTCQFVRKPGRGEQKLVAHSNLHRLPSPPLTVHSAEGHGYKEYPFHFLIPIDRWMDAAITTTTPKMVYRGSRPSFPISNSIFLAFFTSFYSMPVLCLFFS